MDDIMEWTQIGPFSDTGRASNLDPGLVPCENDSFIELIASGRRWPISRACVNRLPYLSKLLMDIECDSTQQHRVQHEFLSTACNVNGSRKTRKCQVFLIDESDADNFGDLVTALHCLNGSLGLATIAEASRRRGDILNLLELCHKYMFSSLANQCRRTLAQWLLTPSESTLDEVATVATMFGAREADDMDGSFSDKNERDILAHPVMLAILHRLRLASAEEFADVSCGGGIPTYLLLKLIVFAGNGSDAKRIKFADALIVRAIQLENKSSCNAWSGWDLVALNICRSNAWTNTQIARAIEALWIESLLSDFPSPSSSPAAKARLERYALTPQRRAISDSRHDRPKKPISPQQRRSRAQSFNGLLQPSNVVHMTVNVDIACLFDERSSLDKRVCSQTTPLRLSSRTPSSDDGTGGGLKHLAVALFMIRDVSTENRERDGGVNTTYSYRLCIKLLAQADATFSGVIGFDTSDSGVEECHLVNKRISAEPLVATVFQRETRCVSSIPLRIYGTLTVSSQ